MKYKGLTVEQLNAHARNLIKHLGIEFTELADDYLCAKMPVDYRTQQPFGILHGGASVALAETLGSVGGNLMVDEDKHCVGLEINANHIRSVKDGFIYGKAQILHQGRKTHVWDIKITDEEGKLVCVSRLTVAVVDKK